MKVIGIDPGTRHLGWGIIRAEGTRMEAVAFGVVHTKLAGSLAQRLVEIDEALRKVLSEHTPDEAAVEAIFFAKDPQAASKLGHARGVVLLALARAGFEVHEYPPARVKQSVTGRGRAEKHQVAMMIKAMLGLRELPGEDATDALAVAVTHANISRVDRALRAGRVGAVR